MGGSEAGDVRWDDVDRDIFSPKRNVETASVVNTISSARKKNR